MRSAFLRTLVRLAEQDDRIFLLNGDIGFSVLEPFAEKFPDRYLNVGIAEQNMIGVAAGLALSGKKVFTYSIVNFAITRCLEQIRNDVCHHGADVVMVAVGGGVPYGAQGYSHHGVEDIAFTRVLPNICVAVPADPVEAEWATEALASRRGPGYLRLARGGEPAIHAARPNAPFGALIAMRPPAEVTIIAAGTVLGEAEAACEMLQESGMAVGLESAPVVAPLDVARIGTLARQARLLVVVEEHSASGGLGGAVAEIVSGLPGRCARVLRLGLSHAQSHVVGDQRHLRRLSGIDAAGLCRTIREHAADA